jgi:acyl-CoA thioester hydrolase
MEPFAIKKKIYYHDTDAGGVVYYANYLKYFEEARTEYLLSKGISVQEMAREGFFFVVGGLEIKYKSPARYADELSITAKIEKVKAASIEFYQEARRAQDLLVECRTKLVSVGKDFKPIALSEEISAALGN